MQEIELKFLIPQAHLKGLMRQVKIKSSQQIHMTAHYYDTSEQDLADAGIGLRIRQEDNIWVQTIKAGGDGIAARLEHNTLLDNEHVQVMLDTKALMPDLTLYKDTAIAPALASFKIKKLSKKLTRQYVTDIQRTTRLLEDGSQKESKIEIAYDIGQIIHGDDSNHSLDIHEIEFELLSGDIEFLFATARTWCKRYKLCLSTVTKAERGGLLLKGQPHSPPVSADVQQFNVAKDISMPAFVRAVVHNCLLQILPNSSAIAAGSENNNHVLQLYMGIDRLQLILKSFGKFSEQLNTQWQPILNKTATSLANFHRVAQLATDIEPSLQKHGAPTVDWTAELENLKFKPINLVAANDFQLTLLELIEFTMSNPDTESQAGKLAMDKLPKILSQTHIKLLEAEHAFSNIKNVESDSSYKEELLYSLYHHLNHLVYISEFAAPLYSKKKSRYWLKRLRAVQKILGPYQNNQYYQTCYQKKVPTEPNALYGAGWFAATLRHKRKKLQKRLAKLEASSTFW